MTFYLFLFSSFSKSFFIVQIATYLVNVSFRHYLYMLTISILHFRAIMGLPHTHALSSIMHKTGRGTVCKNAPRIVFAIRISVRTLIND